MSAAAGIGALSISTIEGTYRGNQKYTKRSLIIYCYQGISSDGLELGWRWAEVIKGSLNMCWKLI